MAEYGPLLSRVASSYEANDALRQELLQEIALAVWQGLKRFGERSSLKTYVLKIAHNRAVTHVASQVREPASHLFDEEHVLVDSAITTNPESAYAQQTQLQQMLNAVRALPLPARQVLTLSLEGLSYDEISDVCGLTRNHVGVLLKRAKDSVSRSLENE